MAAPTGLLAYYPDPNGPVRLVEIPGWNAAESWLLPVGEDARSFTGRAVSERHHPLRPVLLRIVWDLRDLAGQSLFRELETFLNHAQRGAEHGLFLAALDSTTAWAGFAPGAPAPETQDVVVDGKLYAWLSGSPAANMEVRLQQCAGEGLAEVSRISSVSGSRLLLTDAIRFEHGDGDPLLVSESGTYPGLWIPQQNWSQGMLRPENGGFTARFEVIAEQHPHALRAHRETQGEFSGETTGSGVSFEGSLDLFNTFLQEGFAA